MSYPRSQDQTVAELVTNPVLLTACNRLTPPNHMIKSHSENHMTREIWIKGLTRRNKGIWGRTVHKRADLKCLREY